MKRDHIFTPFGPHAMHDVSVGNGFTTINVSASIRSGRGNRVDPLAACEHLKNNVYIVVVMPGSADFQRVALYAVHEIPDEIPPQKACFNLPAVAKIGTSHALIPAMETYQYQWTGHDYGWVPG